MAGCLNARSVGALTCGQDLVLALEGRSAASRKMGRPRPGGAGPSVACADWGLGRTKLRTVRVGQPIWMRTWRLPAVLMKPAHTVAG